MKVGIVGHEAAKFTEVTKATALKIIDLLLKDESHMVISGHCHLGGIDIWAEQYADERHRSKLIFPPKNLNWSTGYKPRNILIAKNSDVLANIVVRDYHPKFTGKRFEGCYHCNTDRPSHVKSGGCWTANYVLSLNKPASWFIIDPNGEYEVYKGVRLST